MLHDEVNYIFSAAWQKRILEEETQLTQEKRIKKIVGEDDYARLVESAGTSVFWPADWPLSAAVPVRVLKMV